MNNAVIQQNFRPCQVLKEVENLAPEEADRLVVDLEVDIAGNDIDMDLVTDIVPVTNKKRKTFGQLYAV